VVEKLRTVHIGDVVASKDSDDVLVAYGLGSCVVICLYDPMAKVGAMLHALLPTTPDAGRFAGKPAKYVDQGVPLLVNAYLKLGARRIWTVAKMCGGAQMLEAASLRAMSGLDGHLNVGDRNVLAAQKALRSSGLRLKAQATGGRAGRTVKLHLASGEVTVKTLGNGLQVLE
jgi:chemotaxis protein CheD